MPKRSLPNAAAGSASGEPSLQRRRRDLIAEAIAAPTKQDRFRRDRKGQASGTHGPLDLVPAPGGAESDNSEVATVAVDGGGQASGTHGPLDLVPAPGGEVAKVAVDGGGGGPPLGGGSTSPTLRHVADSEGG